MLPTTDEMETDASSSLAQAAVGKVQDLVEAAAQVLGTPELDDSSLGKLAEMSKELELEMIMEVDVDAEGEEGVLVQHPGTGDEQNEPEEEVHDVASNHYVTAPSSPIIHVTTFTSTSTSITTTTTTADLSAMTSTTTTTTPTTPSLSRRGSKDAHQHSIGRKLRFTTISGQQSTIDAEKMASRRSTTSLDVQFNEGWVASDPGTPNISETYVRFLSLFLIPIILTSFLFRMQSKPDSSHTLTRISRFFAKGSTRSRNTRPVLG